MKPETAQTILKLKTAASALLGDSRHIQNSADFSERLCDFFDGLDVYEMRSVQAVNDHRAEVAGLVTSAVRLFGRRASEAANNNHLSIREVWLERTTQFANALKKHGALHGTFLDELKKHSPRANEIAQVRAILG